LAYILLTSKSKKCLKENKNIFENNLGKFLDRKRSRGAATVRREFFHFPYNFMFDKHTTILYNVIMKKEKKCKKHKWVDEYVGVSNDTRILLRSSAICAKCGNFYSYASEHYNLKYLKLRKRFHDY